MVPESISAIARAVAARNGRALIVGGYVRDHLLGIDSKDLDVEVYGLSVAELEDVLAGFGAVTTVGRSFGVLRLAHLDVDFSLPRRDLKIAPGHVGFEIAIDPTLDFTEASRRRDLTINSMGLDPLTGEVLDPHGGRRDLAARLLRATDRGTFSEDPLRGLRVAQFAARFLMQPDPELVELCRALDLSELSPERIFGEMRKLLCRGVRPSIGLALLSESGQLRFFPEVAQLVGVAQDEIWHPEGDVFAHTLLTVDAAAAMRDGGDDDEPLMFAALCHDFGKATTSARDAEGRIRSLGHDLAGVPLARSFLERMRAPNLLVTQVTALVEQHLAPSAFAKHHATAKAYRRLARKLGEAKVTLGLLARLARADTLGRTDEQARTGNTERIDSFAAQARALTVLTAGPKDVVLGRHLVARGLLPSPAFASVLARCREIQDETGESDPERILDRALTETQAPD